MWQRFLLLMILVALPAAQTYAGSVTLVWDAVTDSRLAGYKIYVGKASRIYDRIIPVGNVLTYKVEELNVGERYFFAATAVGTGGEESDYSNEVNAITPSSMRGDLNGDSAVNVLDMQLMVNAILGTTNVSGGDLNGDGTNNVLDLQILCNIILGL